MSTLDIWKNESVKLPKPVTEWKRYCLDTQIQKVKSMHMHKHVTLVRLNLYDDVWVMAVLKKIFPIESLKYSILTLDEILLHRRLARNDGRNFFIADSPSPPGLITSIGYTYNESKGKIGILFPPYDHSLEKVPLDKMTSELRFEIFTQVLCGLRTIHSWGYRHNDIKLANIFVNHSEKPEVVLADFGLCDVGKRALCTVQTEEYRPFECYGTVGVRSYSQKTDIFAFMRVYLALTRKRKFSKTYFLQSFSGDYRCGRTQLALDFFKQLESKTSIDDDSSVTCEKDEWMPDSVILSCLALDPSKRPSSFELARMFGLKKTKPTKQEKTTTEILKVPTGAAVFPLHFEIVNMILSCDSNQSMDKVFINKKIYDTLVFKTGMDFEFLDLLCFLLRTMN